MHTNASQEIDHSLTVGVDATNIRLGGGVTHLIELFSAFDHNDSKIRKIVVWGCKAILKEIPDFSYIKKINPPFLEGGILARVFWQALKLTASVRAERCDVLFVPGGSYVGSFFPVVSMCQNLLPFENTEIKRCWPSLTFFKRIMLRIIQSQTFKRSQGVIFLSQYSMEVVESITGKLKGYKTIIPHGFHKSFLGELKRQLPIESYSKENPYQLLYISNIDIYKHQVNVLRAVKILVDKGFPLKITFIGPGSNYSIKKLQYWMRRFDKDGRWSRYLGKVAYRDIGQHYKEANLGVFASSCETFGIILLEKMGAGLPVACSNMSSMPEILKDGGAYFNPEDPESIAAVVKDFILSPKSRYEKQIISSGLAKKYSWKDCALATFSFLERVALSDKGVK
jgi:glycosyltransferase involved in cell wall biosynthesis